ncbi:hypothetical protein V8E36_004618 [Tilletia maclaganii]
MTPMPSGSFNPAPVGYVSPFKMPEVYPTPPQLQLSGPAATPGMIPNGTSGLAAASGPHPQQSMMPPASSALMPSGLLSISTAGASSAASSSSAPHSVGLHHPHFTPMQSPAITPASVFSQMSAASMGSTNDFFSPLTSPALGPDHMAAHHAAAAAAAATAAAAVAGSASAVSSPLFMPHKQMQAQMQGQSTTPTASPLALIGKPSPASGSGSTGRAGGRAGRGEGKASKVRPSPIIKPTDPKNARHRNPSSASGSTATNGGSMQQPGSASSSHPTLTQPSPSASPHFLPTNSSSSTGASGNSSSSSSTTVGGFPSIFAHSPHSARNRMDASPSEAASTPSPIDLSITSMLPPVGGGNSKPLTPGTVMGIRAGGGLSSALQHHQKHSPSQPSSLSEQHGLPSSSNDASPELSSAGSSGPANKGKAKADQSVRFADEPLQRSASLSKGSSKKATAAAAAAAAAANPSISASSSSATTGARASGLESRRTSHKAAEQKRRDSLKFCFDELRGYLPNITLDEDAPGGSTLCHDGFGHDAAEEGFDWDEVRRVKLQQELGILPPMPARPGLALPPAPEYTVAPRGSMERAHRQEREMAARRLANKGISKVALLRHSNEYLVRLKKRLERREETIEVLEMDRNLWRDKFLALEGQLRGLEAAAVAAAAASAATGGAIGGGMGVNQLGGEAAALGDGSGGVVAGDGKMDGVLGSGGGSSGGGVATNASGGSSGLDTNELEMALRSLPPAHSHPGTTLEGLMGDC